MRPEAEEVVASELNLGDEIWIPNSRRPQAIDQKVIENETLRLVVGDASWVVKPDQMIRRVKKAD